MKDFPGPGKPFMEGKAFQRKTWWGEKTSAFFKKSGLHRRKTSPAESDWRGIFLRHCVISWRSYKKNILRNRLLKKKQRFFLDTISLKLFLCLFLIRLKRLITFFSYYSYKNK
jgi:hypothetical protein